MSDILWKPTLDEQRLMFHQIDWADKPAPIKPAVTPARPQTGRPAEPAADRGPYWEFSWELNLTSGIVITNLVAVDTTVNGMVEPVAERIDFTDFKVAFENTATGGFEDFDVAAAFAHPESEFRNWRNGERFLVSPSDKRFQQGLLLKLVNEFGGTCKVTMMLSVVFRRAANDFDPGGIPVAMEVFPQISYMWKPLGTSTRPVRQFRGSVRVTVNNRMPSGMDMHHADAVHTGHANEPRNLPPGNIANLFADSNVSFNTLRRAVVTAAGAPGIATVLTAGGRILGFLDKLGLKPKPFGWGMIFDYTRLNLQTEQEYRAVYGPDETAQYSGERTRTYFWPNVGLSVHDGFRVTKKPRQGYYDNIHLHAQIPALDHPFNNEQVHAPFCGHSCVHMHWRWSDVSSRSAEDDRGWQYKGWSTGRNARAHSDEGAPLVPPNQKVTVALCRPEATRFDPQNILNPGVQNNLHVLRKMIWYCADVMAPINVGAQQVIMEHGLGWGYRYAFPSESRGIGELMLLLEPTIFNDPPEQHRLMRFFEESVYPAFRYWRSGLTGPVVNQVPEGTYSTVDTGAAISMESL